MLIYIYICIINLYRFETIRIEYKLHDVFFRISINFYLGGDILYKCLKYASMKMFSKYIYQLIYIYVYTLICMRRDNNNASTILLSLIYYIPTYNMYNLITILLLLNVAHNA